MVTNLNGSPEHFCHHHHQHFALKALFGRGEGFEKQSGHSGGTARALSLYCCAKVSQCLRHSPTCHTAGTLAHCSTRAMGHLRCGRYLWISSLRLGSGCSQVAAAFPYHTIATCPCLPHHHQNEDPKISGQGQMHTLAANDSFHIGNGKV